MPYRTRQIELSPDLASFKTESGASLLTLAEASPVLLIFLRHFGCSFCRQAISDVSDIKEQLEARGVRPLFVHLGSPSTAKRYFDYYHLETVERISNPDASLYQHPLFDLSRQHPIQLLNVHVWKRWLGGPLFRHGAGLPREDEQQMPGIFFLKDGYIAQSFQYKTIADEPDYLRLTECR